MKRLYFTVSGTRAALVAAVGLGLWAASVAAHAGLGDWDTQKRLSGGVNTGYLSARSLRKAEKRENYVVYESTYPADSASPTLTLREFATEEGHIFAVAWRGLSAPDLSEILSGYYDEFKDSMRTRGRPGSRQTSQLIRTPRAVILRSGHQRDLRGKAYDPTLVPQGVSIEELQ